jgi:hypothetical protein
MWKEVVVHTALRDQGRPLKYLNQHSKFLIRILTGLSKIQVICVYHCANILNTSVSRLL